MRHQLTKVTLKGLQQSAIACTNEMKEIPRKTGLLILLLFYKNNMRRKGSKLRIIKNMLVIQEERQPGLWVGCQLNHVFIGFLFFSFFLLLRSLE